VFCISPPTASRRLTNCTTANTQLLPTMLKAFFNSALARNTTWMIIGQGLRLVIQALYFVEIARSLGVRNYGAFVGVVALVAIVYPFGALGSGNLLVKNVSLDKTLFPTYWGRALVTTAICGSILLLLVMAISHFVLPPQIPLLLVLLVGASDLFGLNIITISGQAFQSFERLNRTAMINVLMSAGRLLGAIVLIAIHPHPSPLEWGYIYFTCTATVAIIAAILVNASLGRPLFRHPFSRKEMREGFYFSAGQTAQTVYNDIDKMMLARLGTLEATGIYGAAYRLIDVSFVPISSLLWATYPNFFRAGNAGISSALNFAKPLLLRALVYAAAICAILLAFANLVPLILGPDYAPTAEALRWLAVLPVFKSLHYFLSDTLTGSGYQAVRTSLQAGVAVFNVIINLWLIPAFSWRGAAWSSIASDALLLCGVALAVFILSRRSGPALNVVMTGAPSAS
jgi:O-antigen/teichoic acid export membrane protein